MSFSEQEVTRTVTETVEVFVCDGCHKVVPFDTSITIGREGYLPDGWYEVRTSVKGSATLHCCSGRCLSNVGLRQS